MLPRELSGAGKFGRKNAREVQTAKTKTAPPNNKARSHCSIPRVFCPEAGDEAECLGAASNARSFAADPSELRLAARYLNKRVSWVLFSFPGNSRVRRDAGQTRAVRRAHRSRP
jgi:hypothetical protein